MSKKHLIVGFALLFASQVAMAESVPGGTVEKPWAYCSSSGSCCVSLNGNPCCLIDADDNELLSSPAGDPMETAGSTCNIQSSRSCGGSATCCRNGVCTTTDALCCDDAGGHGPVAGVACGGGLGLCCNGANTGMTEEACCLGIWMGAGLTCDSDVDGDGICDDCDNCVDDANANQWDFDGDGVGDECDTCIATADPSNVDDDGDTYGDVCDNCPFNYNPGQEDTDQCGFGENNGLPCDTDADCPDGYCADDGVGDICDNCPDHLNVTQDDTDLACDGGDNAGVSCSSDTDCPNGVCVGDGIGDVCDDCVIDNPDDTDGDGICDSADNCPNTPNTDQANCDAADGDTLGDACDPDIDNDTILNDDDTCDFTPLGLRFYVHGTGHPLAGTVEQDVDGDCDVDVNDISSVTTFSSYSGGSGCADGS